MTRTLYSLVKSKINNADVKTLKKLKEYIIDGKTLLPGVLKTASEYANKAITQQTGGKSSLHLTLIKVAWITKFQTN